MAQYAHLPIYNKATAVLREFYMRVPKFSKQYKYLLGGKILEHAIEVIKLIIRANGEREKGARLEIIEHLSIIIEVLITELRIANELRQLGGQKSYLYLCEMLVDLSKQAGGWKKYIP